MVINKLLTKVNFTKGVNKNNKYIVIHYVGAEGGAKDNCRYFEKVNRGASANYFVGHLGEIWQCVEDKDIAWHCGAVNYKHSYCRNSNSIGIEMCCRKQNGKWYFEDATITSTIGLVKELMKKYGIPVENVIRHYDVTGKNCPAPYVEDGSAWNNFKTKLKEADLMPQVDNTPDEYAEKAIQWAVKNGILVGDSGNYKLHSNVTRQDVLVFLYRAMGGK
jgi:N-acetylmuramoyl-L-alanine amidase CwlA